MQLHAEHAIEIWRPTKVIPTGVSITVEVTTTEGGYADQISRTIPSP